MDAGTDPAIFAAVENRYIKAAENIRKIVAEIHFAMPPSAGKTDNRGVNIEY